MDRLRGTDMNDRNVTLRRLQDDEMDYRLLDKWCGEEEVYRYFEQRILTPGEIRRKYRPRTREDAAVPVYMIECGGQPVGIVQYQKADEDGAYEIDLFIGEAEARNRGIGRQSVLLISRFLFCVKRARMLVMCPVADNLPAVRCYLRCGFTEAGCFTAPDTVGAVQEYVRMVMMNPDRM